MDPAKEYLYTGEVRKKFEVGIFFYLWKSVKILTLRGPFIIGVLFKTRNRLHPIFFDKLHLDIYCRMFFMNFNKKNFSKKITSEPP